MTGYYAKHAREYFEETVHIDPAPFLAPFAERLAADAEVLDIGCGSGRDLAWLKSRGFRPLGFERSPGLAALARKHGGCPVIEGDFADYDFSTLEMDGILCCGALVHVPHHRLGEILKNITAALDRGKDEQLLYVSLKEGRGQAEDERGRIFYYWQDEPLRSVFSAIGFSVDDFLRLPSADGEGKTWLGYVLVGS